MTISSSFSALKFLPYVSRGCTYIRAYRNEWVPKQTDADGNVIRKGYSKPKEQHQAGPLRSNGRVRLSAKFLLKFPEFEGVDWFYFKGDLVDEQTYYKLTDSEAHEPTGSSEASKNEQSAPANEAPEAQDDGPVDDQSKESNVRDFLPHFALSALAVKSGIRQSLERVFGRKEALQLLDLAIYQLLCGKSADCFEEWAYDQYLSEASAKMGGREISALLRRCSETAWDNFWRLRYEHSLKDTGGKTQGGAIRFCAFDSTSISTYADLDDAAFGHARQDPELKQINLAVVFDQFSGDLVYAFVYEGSVNDKASYSYIFERMKGAGFPMQQIMLITDRSYYGANTAEKLLREGVHYLSGVPLAKGSVEENWILKQGQSITDQPQYWDPLMHVSCFTLKEKWRLPDTPQKETYTHIYYDPDHARDEKVALNDLLTTTLDSLNKNITVDKSVMAKARPYLRQIIDPNSEPHKMPRKMWTFDNAAIKRHHGLAGFFVIKTDAVSDPMLAQRLYRMRWRIEQGFAQMKNEVNGRRLRVQENSYRGKVLLFLIATALRVRIRFNLEQHKVRVPNAKISIPGNSVTKLLMRMNTFKIRRGRSTEQWLCDLLPKQVRDWIRILFLSDAPPQRFS